METTSISYDLAQAYLEMARAHHGAPVVAASGINPEEMRMTNNTALALVAHGYVFSFMALNAFVSGCLWKIWELPDSPLKAKFPGVSDFKHLLSSDLKELKKCISELCEQYKLEPLYEADSKSWNDLLQVVKTTRDFMTHPTPDASDFDKIVGDAMEKYTWTRPAQIVEQVMRYFYTNQTHKMPKWLDKNQEFCFKAICALSVQSRL